MPLEITVKKFRSALSRLDKQKLKRSIFIEKLQAVDNFVNWASEHNYLEKYEVKQIKQVIDKKVKTLKFGIFGYVFSTLHTLRDNIFQSISNKTKRLKPDNNSNIQLNSSFQKYVVAIFILIIVALLGYGVYRNFFVNVSRPYAYPSQPLTGKRILSFQGRLTDSIGNPINIATQVTFRLWKTKRDLPTDPYVNEGTCTGLTGEDCLYSTGVCSITPDSDGIFSTVIGDSCGSQITTNVFSENQNIYLGITVGPDTEMTPRKQVANVGYAINSETLQGLPAGDNTSSIPYINQDGNLLIAASTPGIKSTNTSATFTISSAKAVTIQSGDPLVAGGDILIQATTSGVLKFRTGGDTDTYNRIVVDNNGNVGIGNSSPSYTLDVTGNTSVSGNLMTGGQLQLGRFYNSPTALNGGSIIYNTSDNKAYYYNGSSWVDMSGGSSAGTNYWAINTGAMYPVNSTVDLLIGGNSTASAKFAFINVNNGTPTASISGNITLAGDSRTIGATNMKPITIGNSTTGDIKLDPAGATTMTIKNGGNVGIGTTSPGTALDVASGRIRVTSNAGTPTSGTGLEFFSDGSTTGDVLSYDRTGGSYKDLRLRGSNIMIYDGTTYGLYVKSGGNVGVGTTSPAAKLDVNGNLNVSGYATASSSLAVGYTSAPAGPGNAVFSGNVGIGTTAPGAQLQINAATTSNTGLVIKTTDDNTTKNLTEWQNSSGTVLSSINSSGYLRIGGSSTSSPLYVSKTFTDAATETYGQIGQFTFNTTADTSATYRGTFLQANTSNSTYNQSGTTMGLYVDTHGRATGGTTAAIAGIIGQALTDTASTANYTSLYGLQFNAQHFGTGTTTNAYGTYSSVQLRASGGATDGNITTAVGNYSALNNASTAATPGVIASGYAYFAGAPAGSGAITINRGMYIDNQGRSGVTSAYGLYLASQSGAATNNYAIYTNAGLNQLGDQLKIVGSADRQQLIIKGNSTQTSNLQEWQDSSATVLGSINGSGGAKFASLGLNTTASATSGRLSSVTSGNYGTWIGYSHSDTNWHGLFVQSARSRGTSSSPTAVQSGDFLMDIKGTGYDGVSNYYSGAEIRLSAEGTISSGVIPGVISFLTANSSGTLVSRLKINSTGSVIINDDGIAESDFRVEGDTDANLLFTDASADKIGIGTSTPSYKLDVVGDASASGNLMTGGQLQLGRFGSSPTALAGGSVYYNSGNNKAYYYNGADWVDMAGGSGTNYWNLASGALYPVNATVDLLIGGTASSSAKFAFKNVLAGTPTASISGSTANVATFIDGNGNISSTNRNDLTLGNSATYNTTGNVLINPNGTGNVGIGTTSPANKLHLVSTASDIARFDGSSNNFARLLINATTAGSDAQVSFMSAQSTKWSIGNDATDNSFHINNASGAFDTTSELTILSGGNVGIGTTSPSQMLHLSTTADAGIYLEADRAGTSTEDNNAFVKFSQDGTTVQSILGTVGNAGYDPENNPYTGTLANSTLLGTLDSNGALHFGTNDNVRMTIDTSGYISMGTTVNTSKFLNISSSQDISSASKYGVYNNFVATGTLTSSNRSSYGLYTAHTNNVNRGYYTNTLYGSVTGITNPNGYTYDTAYASYNSITNNDAVFTATTSAGVLGYINNAGNGNLTNTRGVIGQVYNSGTGTLADARGLQGTTSNGSSGTVTAAYGNRNYVSNNTTGTISDAYGNYNLLYQAASGGTINNAYGSYSLIDQDGGTLNTGYLYYGIYASGTYGTKWGLYLTGETNNYLSGNVGIGTSSPGAKLQVNGDASAITSIFKANATTPGDLTQWQNSSGTLLSAVSAAGNFGIGVAPSSSYKLYVYDTNTTVTGNNFMTDFVYSANPSGTSDGNYSAITGSAQTSSGNAQNITGSVRGLNYYAMHSGTGLLSDLRGNSVFVQTNNSGNVTHASAYWGEAVLNANSGSMTNAYIFRALNPYQTAGTGTIGSMYGFYSANQGNTYVTSAYGLYLADQSGATNNYAIVTNAGNIVFNEGGDASTDFRVEGDTDANLLFTDASADMVGIGKNNPSYKLDVSGNASVSGNLMAGGQLQLGRFGSSPTALNGGSVYYNTNDNKVYYYNSSSWAEVGTNYWTQTAGTLYPNNPSIDLLIGGTSSASAKFAFINVNNGTPTASISGNITLAGASRNIGSTSMNSLTLGNSTTGDIIVSPAGTTAMTVKNGGNVGIGTTSPNQKLEISEGTNYALKITNPDAGGGYWNITQSDDAFAVGGGRLLFVPDSTTSTNAKVVFTNAGSVGIGITNPGERLDIDLGNIRAAALVDATNSNFIANPAGTSYLDGIQIGANGAANYGLISQSNGILSLKGSAGVDDSAVDTSVCIGDAATCSQKLDAGTIDPPYTINGKKYSTYMASMVGVKEEATGQLTVDSKNSQNYFEKIIDFSRLEEASDLWLFSKTTNLKNNIDKMTVLISPENNTRTWYKVDKENYRLTVYSARPTKISYRLTAPRFDYTDHQNTRNTAHSGFVLNDPDIAINLNSQGEVNEVQYTIAKNTEQNNQNIIYKISSSINEFVEEITVAQKAVFAQIEAGLIKTKQLIVQEKIISPVVETEKINVSDTATIKKVETAEIKLPDNQNELTINLNKGALSKLVIKGLENHTVAVIDTEGNATFSGTIAAREASISGIIAASEASISGTLTAKEVKAANIDALQQKTEQLASSSEQLVANNQQLTTDNQSLASNINEIQKLINDIKNQTLPDATYYQDLVNDNQPLVASSSSTNSQSLIANNQSLETLSVTGNSNLYNVTVAGSISTGGLMIENNSVLSLSWQLRLSSLGTINLFDDAVVIAKDGTITTRGTLIAKGGIQTSTIKIQNDHGEEVASIDASGSAQFNNLAINKLSVNQAASNSAVIAAEDNFTRNGILSPAIETTKEIAGTGLIPTSKEEVIVYNDNIKNNTLVYLTPTEKVPDGQLTVVNKETCSSNTTTCRPYFKVATNHASDKDLKFNWLIIN